MSILIIDDDVNIRRLIAIQLKQKGYHTIDVPEAKEALEIINHPDNNIELAIVDVMMPGMDGFTLTSILSKEYEIPVILLTAKGQLQDKERGFMSGSDDYIVKPFEIKELIFRVAVVLRRNKKLINKISVGNVQINRETYELEVDDQIYIIPLKEFEIIAILMEHIKRPVSREYLLEEVWGLELGTEQSLNTHINRIRERLKLSHATLIIKTLRGIGYKMEVVQE
ncbi:response regulator transcription factor [Shouchella patagoniensis]|uniref:response regulator transcription factor n=1 Tax=Shouchella patagoniensis TaxID=228576 RepID=UPI0009949215|nr:response regulator transcription factor [Shouchella patagoniensis]